ncbi:Sideroflexin-1 [Exaiptasia diaphana]|nr:Sideroflexin-1 [Exaiptasia diaphana]
MGSLLQIKMRAAEKAISSVVLSRIGMAAPGMFLPPFVMNYLDTKPFMKRFPILASPIQVMLVGLWYDTLN